MDAEDGLRCPLCGNSHIIATGSFYQCQSRAEASWSPGMSGRDPSWREPYLSGCGYLGPRIDFEIITRLGSP